MYSLYRRHEKTCRFRGKGVRHIKCQCPVWMDGFDERGKRQRRSLNTRSWSHAQARLVEIEDGRVKIPEPDRAPTLAAAIRAFLDDCRARKLQSSTIISYTNSLGHLSTFFAGRLISQVDLAGLSTFRATRAITAHTATKEIRTMRSFFLFCAARKWISENPAKHLKAPKADLLPTMPFTEEEVLRILEACGRIDNRNPHLMPRARLRARALVLLLLYSGFRISDAVKLQRARLDMKTGKLLVRMMKTRVPMYTRLPPAALEALAAVPVESQYFFWSGKGQLSTAIKSARRTIDCVLKLAEVADGHPHRFRDTFSVELLLNGAELRTVQLLLGHTSIRTTEKHYAPYVVSMQRVLDEAVSTLHFGSDANPQPPPLRPTVMSLAPRKRQA